MGWGAGVRRVHEECFGIHVLSYINMHYCHVDSSRTCVNKIDTSM